MASASCLSLLVLVALASSASAQLSSTFYDRSCPRALATIKSAVNAAVSQEARMGASLLRLHFHDCFVQNDPPNLTLRGFNVIANIKAQVEAICKQTVSCADILAVAARDSVVALGGPSWTVPLGRRDSLKAASTSMVLQNLIPPTSSLTQLIQGYGNLGLNPTDLVALSGAHTIGQAHCPSYQDHIYNDTNINQAFAASLKANCPATGGSNVMAPLDTTTPNAFDNAYFKNLQSQKGLLHSDQELFNGGSTDNTVRNFASNPSAFSSAFVTAMIKMGNISPLTGTQGQIRTTCSAANP
uniref:Peroxidase n=1 Tax=Setaria italica TaxID=4555 RepID=K3ZVM7_SETIT